MKKLMIIIAIFLAMAMPAQTHSKDSSYAQKTKSNSPEASPRFTIKDWARLKKQDRMVIIISAIESLLLATQSQDGGKTPVNPVCLTNDSPLGIEAKLMNVSKRYPNDAFVDIFLIATNCLESST